MRSSQPLALLACLALVVACSRPAATPQNPTNPPPPDEVGPAAGPDPEIVALNLDFETAEVDQPSGWTLRGEGYALGLDSIAKSGSASLKLASVDPAANAFAVASSSYPVARAHGKRLKLRGYIKAEDVAAGYAGLWVRVDGKDGAMLSLDNMSDRGVTGTTDWRRVEIEVDVPAEATNVVFGAILTGRGAAWVDALQFELGESPVVPSAVQVAGTVVGPGGKPVANAFIAVFPVFAAAPLAEGRVKPDGTFSFTVPPGKYRLSASAPELRATVAETRNYDGTGEPSRVTLEPGGITIRGRVRDENGKPVSGAGVWAMIAGSFVIAPHYTQSGADGRYAINVARDLDLAFWVQSEQVYGSTKTVRSDRARGLDLRAVRRVPAPETVTNELGKRAIHLKAVTAGADLGDMEPLRRVVGRARVVALGEATHGTREIFQMKHRMLEFLVGRMGFTVFAIEASFSNTMVVNDYVLHGKGTAKDGLAAMQFWTWRTEEVRELIEWMRTYNADASHKTKLKFLGFDMQGEQPAVKVVVDYLAAVDSGFADAEAALKESPNAIVKRLDTRRREYERKSSPARWELARQHAVVYGQFQAMWSGPKHEAFNTRDKSMADNVRWILKTEPKGTKIVVWAHNAHVGRELTGLKPMGRHLSDALGAGYRIFAFAFGDGGFQAMGGKKRTLRAWEVGAPPPESIDAAFRKAGCSVCVLDLRRVPRRSALGRWIELPRVTRGIGALFTTERDMESYVRWRILYDSVIYIDRTTRARPVQ